MKHLAKFQFKKLYSQFLTITSIHATLFMAYRIYVHYRQNKLNFIHSDDFKERDSLPYKTFNLSEHEDKIKEFDFEDFEDSLGKGKMAFFEYKGVIFTLAHYESDKPHHYTLWIDIQTCKTKKINPAHLAEKFIFILGLGGTPVTWFNKDWKILFDDYL